MNGVNSSVSFSPDGRRFVYLHWTPDRKDRYSEMFVAYKDGGKSQLVYATSNPAEPPAWSPDGNRLAWLELVGARKVDLKLLDIASKKITRVPTPDDIYLHSGSQGHTYLDWLPDGKHLVALYQKPQSDRFQIGIFTVPSGEFRTLTNDVNSYTELSISGDGRRIAAVLSDIDSSIQFYPPSGGQPIKTMPLRITPNALAWVDEDHLLFITRGVGISSFDRTTGAVHPLELGGELTTGSSINRCPNGQILFTATPKGTETSRIFRMNPDGSGITQLTFDGEARAPFCSRTTARNHSLRDGRSLLYGPFH